jgi:hypothetical protein
MTPFSNRRFARLRLSDRAFWGAITLGCACILSSSAGSQRTTNNIPAVAGDPPPSATNPAKPTGGALNTGAPTPYLRTRIVEITDAQGRARIRMLVRADGEAVIEFVRPGGNANAPTLVLYDMLRGKPDMNGKIPPKTAFDGATGIHLNGPPRDGQFGLIQMERAGGSDATIRLTHGNDAGSANSAVLDASAVRFLKSGNDIKARAFGFEP